MDFGGSKEKILQAIAPYIHNEEERMFLEKNALDLKIEFQEYDWRLNRSRE